MTADFGLIGLAVMGENLALNIESRGYTIAVFNRTTSKVDELIAGRAAGKKFIGCHSLEELVEAVKPPRKIMMMIKAGPAVDEQIEHLIPLLSPGDVIIDGGNEHYTKPTLGRQLMDLKTARDTGAIGDTEYEQAKEDLLHGRIASARAN